MVKIVKGVPIPRIRYPWKKMEVGDSFLFPKEISHPQVGSIVAKATKRYSRMGCKYVTRKTDEGIRVWRVK